MSRPAINTISVQELHALGQKTPVEIIDVRTPGEYREVRIAGAKLLPMDSLDPHELVRARTLATSEPLYFVCHLGGRSAHVCLAMKAAGYENVVNITGGTEAWAEAGLPVERG